MPDLKCLLPTLIGSLLGALLLIPTGAGAVDLTVVSVSPAPLSSAEFLTQIRVQCDKPVDGSSVTSASISDAKSLAWAISRLAGSF